MQVKRVSHIDLAKKIQQIKGIKAKVGFFSSAVYEDGTPVAEVAIQNEFGVPQKNIPPRPFMRPAMDNQGTWKTIFKNESIKAFKTGNFKTPFVAVASTVQGNIKENIATLKSPALADSTIQARKNKSSKKNPAKTIEKPLVDSGLMLTSVQYEVSK